MASSVSELVKEREKLIEQGQKIDNDLDRIDKKLSKLVRCGTCKHAHFDVKNPKRNTKGECRFPPRFRRCQWTTDPWYGGITPYRNNSPDKCWGWKPKED